MYERNSCFDEGRHVPELAHSTMVGCQNARRLVRKHLFWRVHHSDIGFHLNHTCSIPHSCRRKHNNLAALTNRGGKKNL